MNRPHPIIVIVSATTLTISSLFAHKLISLVIVYALFIFASLKLRLPIKPLILGIARAWPLLLFAGLVHFALSGGNSEVLGYFTIINFTYEGLQRALFFIARLGLIVAVSLSLFNIYDAQRYGREIGRLAGRLPIKLQVIARAELVLTLALRFVPFLKQEYGRLRMALAARGVNSGTGFVARVTRLRVLAVPLLLSAFRRADHVALALEARGYNPAVRMTAFRVLRPRNGEYIGCALLCACCIGALWL